MIGQYTGVPCSEKQALFFFKTFPFLRAWMLALLVSEWDFQLQLSSSLIEIIYCFIKVSIHFLSNCLFSRVIAHSMFT